MDELGKAKDSSISVAVRIRPLTPLEKTYIQDEYESLSIDGRNRAETDSPNGEDTHFGDLRNQRIVASSFPLNLTIKRVLDVVDDRMLIFDPKNNNSRGITRRHTLNSGSIGSHNRRHKEHKFIFDKLFDEQATQNDVYEHTAKPSVDAVLDGFNSTIFAYGATGCGKTFTITGTPEQPGILFLALEELFQKIEDQTDRKISVQVSYLEIYNETIKDLLNVETCPKRLAILENENQEIIVSNLTKVDTNNVEEVMDVVVKGNYNRTVSPTEANLNSSRSHAVLQVYITQTPTVSDIYEKSTKSILSIIDLAGSERASATKNKGTTLHEGANINKSLLALGNCIKALCDPRKISHVPYRDSKLTRLLKFSLGGNCKTVMIVCVAPSSRHYDETLNALKFANRAKEIKTKVMRNRTTVMKHVGSYMKIISDQKRRIYELETLMNSTIKREVDKSFNKHNRIRNQIYSMIDRLWNNVNKVAHLKVEKIHIVVKRKLMMIYIRQIKDFYSGLERYDTLDKLNDLKVDIYTIIESSTLQLATLAESYNKRSELDSILLDTANAFLLKLKELEGWNQEYEDLYKREVDYLKADIERQVFYESSILLDQLIENSDEIANLDLIPKILAQYLSVVEDVAKDFKTVEEARMRCYQLSDNLVESCSQLKNIELDTLSNELNSTNLKKRRISSNGEVFAKGGERSELSFIRQGNRISSINNKLMRINLSNDEEKYKDAHMDSMSEVDSSLVLETEPKTNPPPRVTPVAQNLFLVSESTPRNENVIDVLQDYESPEFVRKKSYSSTMNDEKFTIPEEDDSNSSVIIRKPKETANSNNLYFRSPISPVAPKVKSEKLTSKKLPASPRITSPHRLLGLDADNNTFQFKLRESMGNMDIFSNKENFEGEDDPSTDISKKLNIDMS